MPPTEYTVSLRSSKDIVEIQRVGGFEKLDISFKRTIRVPDTHAVYQLPPDLGNFPLFRVTDYSQTLPRSMVAKGGLFLPMYQREALWVAFHATSPFAIKIYVGNVNAISGATISAETSVAKPLPKSLTQDYVVVPGQRWLDGIPTKDGIVKQFVAMPLGQGYTVEAQLTDEESVGGLRFEVIPGMPVVEENTITLTIKTLTGTKFDLSVRGDLGVLQLKTLIFGAEGTPPEGQRLFCCGRQLDDKGRLRDYGLDSILRGGGRGPEAPQSRVKQRSEMGIAAGGSIRQSISPDYLPKRCYRQNAMVPFSVQILNAASFRHVTGMPMPKTPVCAKTYADYGLPFYSLAEEPGGIHGDFQTVNTVADIDDVEEEDCDVPDVPVHSRCRPDGGKVTNVDHLYITPSASSMLTPFRHISDILSDSDDATVAEARDGH